MVAPASVVKAKVADDEVEGLAGVLVKDTVGADRSMVKVVAATALTLPPASVERARTV